MTKTNITHTPAQSIKVKKILLAQAKPEGIKSPYFDLAKKYDLTLEFCPFIEIEPIDVREFRRQKVDVSTFTAVIFTSRHSIDNFFRVCEEMKMPIAHNTKYFCITEAIALYLQKFILYRKRKVFYGADGTNKSLFDVIAKHKDNEKFLYPCSQTFDGEITNWLLSNKCEYATPILYKVVSKDIKSLISQKFDIICFFTPGGVKSLLENFPNYKQNGTYIATFGENTHKAAVQAGLKSHIQAPQPKSPSMVSSLEKFILDQNN